MKANNKNPISCEVGFLMGSHRRGCSNCHLRRWGDLYPRLPTVASTSTDYIFLRAKVYSAKTIQFKIDVAIIVAVARMKRPRKIYRSFVQNIPPRYFSGIDCSASVLCFPPDDQFRVLIIRWSYFRKANIKTKAYSRITRIYNILLYS